MPYVQALPTSSSVLSSTYHPLLHSFLNYGVGCVILVCPGLEPSALLLDGVYCLSFPAWLVAGAPAPAPTRCQGAVLKLMPLNLALD